MSQWLRSRAGWRRGSIIALAAGLGAWGSTSLALGGSASARSSAARLSSHSKSGTLKIGLLYLDAQGYYGGVKKGVELAAKAAGQSIQLLEDNSLGDASKESTAMSTFVSGGVNAIIISAVSENGSVAAIKQAFQAKIPVICYNTCINDQAARKYVYAYVLGDPIKFGYMIGTAAGDYFLSHGIKAPKIAIVNCEYVEVCIQRRQGFEQALKAKVPDFQIVSNQAGTEVDQAVTVSEDILRAHPDVNAFWGESGGATLGAVEGVQSSGDAGKVVVFGSDMITQLAQALAKGTVLKADVDISGILVGKQALALALKAIQGRKPSSFIAPANITLYTTAASAKAWLAAHPDGLP